MNDANLPSLTIAFAAGFGLGGLYFGGLWYTVRRVTTARTPGALLAASWLLRTALLMAGLWLITDARWERLAVSLAGIMCARITLFHCLRVHRLTAPAPSTHTGDPYEPQS